jgi:hypothetical protein
MYVCVLRERAYIQLFITTAFYFIYRSILFIIDYMHVTSIIRREMMRDVEQM